ncbi:MAG: hypothetical protein ACR2QC_03430 [Gammaproteobacteria bacterium]
MRQACIDGGESYCDSSSAYTTVFMDQVYFGSSSGSINGVSVNVSDATEAAVLQCAMSNNEAVCRNIIPSGVVGSDHICGDGSQHPTTENDCTREAPMCTGDQMHDILNNACAPANDAGCLAADPTQPIFDNAEPDYCRLPMDDAECMRVDATQPMFDITEADNCRTADTTTPPTDPTDPTPPTDPTTPPANNGGGVIAERDDGAETAAYIGGGMLAVGLASYFLWDGNLLAFSFSPDYGYSLTESGYAYNVGGRLDFQQGDFHSYYAVGQANSDGKFGDLRYESGGKYAADFWTAAFSETVQGETADYDFALSADYHGGIWRLSPTYRLHSRLDEDETETRNSLNLEGILRYNRWTIRPSAGFNWRRPEEFGDNARFNLSAVRRF